MMDDRVAAEWTRGSLPFLVLLMLSAHEAHGYAIAQQLGQLGFGPVRGGSLYPVLNKLESEGSVEATWVAGDAGPGRKTFRLTRAGRVRVTELHDTWDDHCRATSALATGSEAARDTKR